MDAATLPSGHGVHQGIIHPAHLEGSIGNALGLVGCADFDDLHPTNRVIVKRQCLHIIRIDHHGLTSGSLINGIPRNTLHFRHNDGARDTGQHDLPLGVSGVQPIGGQLTALGIHHLAIRIGDLELHPGQRLLRHTVQLVDDKPTQRLIAEFQCHRLPRLDLRRLGCIIQQIARLGAYLFRN